MAVYEVPYAPKYIGLSTDTKPTGVLPGSEYTEVNATTQVVTEYITPDGTNWYPKTAASE